MATTLVTNYGKDGKFHGWGIETIKKVLMGNYMNMKDLGIGRIKVPVRSAKG